MIFLRKISPLLLISFLLIWATTLSVSAQRSLRGKMTYTISYPGSTVDLAELQQLPVKAEIWAKDDETRTELSGENSGLFQIKISDAAKKETATLLEIMNEKYVIKRSADEINNAIMNMTQPEFEYTNETKEILGYTCKKVIARTTDMFGIEQESVIYYTPDIPGAPFSFDTPYREIPGLMLEYEMRVGQLNIRYEIQSLRKRLFVGGRNFYIHRDYQTVTYDELRTRLQGNF